MPSLWSVHLTWVNALRRFVAVSLNLTWFQIVNSARVRRIFKIIWACHLLVITSAKLSLQMAVAASNKSSSKPALSYPDLEEQALQFILDCCEPNIEKYTKYLEVMSFPWHLLHSTTSHKILTICYPIIFFDPVILWWMLLYTNHCDQFLVWTDNVSGWRWLSRSFNECKASQQNITAKTNSKRSVHQWTENPVSYTICKSVNLIDFVCSSCFNS